MSSVRKTEFEVRTLNTVVRVHYTLFILSEFSAVWLAHVFWEHGVVGSNPAIPMPNVMYIFCMCYLLGLTI